MPRKKPPHPLLEYIQKRGLTYRAAAKELRCDFTRLHHVCVRRNRPLPELAKRIVEWTKGEVSYADLYGEP